MKLGFYPLLPNHACMFTLCFHQFQFAAGIIYCQIKQFADKSERNIRDDNVLAGSVELTWKDLTLRFVRYVSEHFLESGEGLQTSKFILETWVAHLKKARTWTFNEAGKKVRSDSGFDGVDRLVIVEPDELDADERLLFVRKQTNLSAWGVVTLLAKVLASLSENANGEFADLSIELLIEMLNGGNTEVQQTLFNYLMSMDTECRFLENLDKRLLRVHNELSDAKKAGILETSDELAVECKKAISTARLIHLLCEGHHQGFQNYVRVQDLGELELCCCLNQKTLN